ncbi:Ubiquitin-like modifier-activating enzyme atg7 [Atta colombica]|uniref:Ubiquitin-like modifier-activating enzyme ATG7 n=1 Tax=Atta colombica TaxID=520822 RepID=A0A195BE66_9HYME|nr:PREDICTED: ubiquitin-like modifier-activating enzyme atg7 isoform X1 [Atta colombica]XP_018048239.1 PREDICTED: ubiquitin-like modifier-activating enzyme atg7 isoform X1 [Atta colombica]KYM82863.1 Ubiquitin-like modifier-activating enzyme atg7 [Atta colombica]
MSEIIRFTKLKTATDPTFWAKFAELKIDKLKLDEKTKIHVWGSFALQPMDEGRTNPLILDCMSFNGNLETTSHNAGVACCGYMININTYEAFRQINPEKFIDTMGKCIIDSIRDGTALQEPSRLSIFLIFAYSDLKKYKFHYWAAHPTPFSFPETYSVAPMKFASGEFTSNQIDKLRASFLQLDARSRNFFTVFVSGKDDLNVDSLSKGVEYIKLNVSSKGDSEQAKEELYFAFYDPCASAEPGWPLRNLLYLLLWHCPMYCFTRNIKILSVRSDKMQTAIIFTLRIKEDKDIKTMRETIFKEHLVGWETNINGKMGPNIADLSNIMDPTKLSDRAINLNLKLMKWRLVPDLDLEKISGLRCLLLGAGTLGCSVARVLLGWGINNMTLVDNSTVSHSNTVRQSLYMHEDAVQRRHKAHAAKDALLRIRPSMNVEGVVLHIPMPGHVVGQSMMETTKEAVNKLQELVNNHDVVFLLLDSREARWLPTLLCAATNKITINAALGFDSYTVQRHGTRDLSDSVSPNLTIQNPAGYDLGCYFCNDVTQPGNSQTDRTLDQQCTVSRPGLSQIAAGLAVELLMAVTQHFQGISARALMNNDRDDCRENVDNPLIGLLGGVPHTIRGSLWGHEMKLTVTHRSPFCTACSTPLIKEYQHRGFAFVLDACNTPNYLEKLSGLEEILKRPDLDELCYTMDSSSEDEES